MKPITHPITPPVPGEFDSLELKHWLKKTLGISQSEMGRRLRINPATVNAYVNGREDNRKLRAFFLKHGCPATLLPPVALPKRCLGCPHYPATGGQQAA